MPVGGRDGDAVDDHVRLDVRLILTGGADKLLDRGAETVLD